MPNLGGAEILVILLVALLVLGPDKLPGAARSIGRGLSHLRKLSGGFEQEIRSAMQDTGITTTSQQASSGAAASGLHPGLGPGPRLEPDSVSLGPSSPAPSSEVSSADIRPRVEGPDESFS